MAENTESKNIVRSIEEILEELFVKKEVVKKNGGKKKEDAALLKYARVRHTQYEMELWLKYECPIDRAAKRHFSKSFLGGKKLKNCSQAEIDEGMKALDHAVKDGCHGRCKRLVEELNMAFEEKSIEPLQNIDAFLDFMTFEYTTRKDDYTGGTVCEPGYGFEVRLFHDTKIRKAFWKEVKSLLSDGIMLPLNRICQIVQIKRNHAKKI